MLAQTAPSFRSTYNELSALCSPALPQSPPVSEPGYQATTFKYLPSKLQRAEASGELHWKEQTIKMPLLLHFDNASGFTSDPYILMSLSTSYVPPTKRSP